MAPPCHGIAAPGVWGRNRILGGPGCGRLHILTDSSLTNGSYVLFLFDFRAIALFWRRNYPARTRSERPCISQARRPVWGSRAACLCAWRLWRW